MSVNAEKSVETLEKMINYFNEIEMFTRGMDFRTFHVDIKTVRAVTNNVLQIGELSKRFDSEFKTRYGRGIDWENLRETRNLIAHGSESISHKRLWDTVKFDLTMVNGVLMRAHHELKLVLDVKRNARLNRQDARYINTVGGTTKGVNRKNTKVSKKFNEEDSFRKVNTKPSSFTKPKSVGYSKYDEYDDYEIDERGRLRNISNGRITTKNIWS